MTEILVFDARGKITFRSVEPRLMTPPQIEQTLKEWCPNEKRGIVKVIYHEKYV